MLPLVRLSMPSVGFLVVRHYAHRVTTFDRRPVEELAGQRARRFADFPVERLVLEETDRVEKIIAVPIHDVAVWTLPGMYAELGSFEY